MKTKICSLILPGLLLLGVNSTGLAQNTPGYNNKIPEEILTPDTVETRIGTLKFFDGSPTRDTVELVYDKFGIEGQLIQGYDHPYLYLTNDITKNPQIDLAALETMIAKELVAFPGVSYAIPSTSLELGTVPDNLLTRAVLNNYNAARPGNVYVVFNPGWFINDLDGLSVAVVHGSPWRHDTYVPIIFAGYGTKPQKVSRRVHTVDVAIPLATAVGMRPPSGAAGDLLLEVLGQ